MGFFFKSSKSHLEQLEADCQHVADASTRARAMCDQSLRGKYEYMAPEQRADLVRDAHAVAKELAGTLEQARHRQAAMDADQCLKEDLLTAETLVATAALDVSRLDKAVKDASESLLSGMAEIEQFYGPRSSEAKHLRRVLAEFQSSF
jgi:hypothetical protein